MSEDEKARAAILVAHRQLKSWLHKTTSCSLLVNGNVNLEAAEGESCLSFVDAQLVRIVTQSDAFVLSYFCAFDAQNDAGAAGVLASFVEQLLTQMLSRGMIVDLSFLRSEQWDALERWDGLILYIVLKELVAQLSDGSVLVCVLDEMTLFETKALGDETDEVMRRLKRLASGSENVIFKLLVTCRGRALDFHQYFDKEEVLEMEEEIEMNDMADWKINNFRGGAW